MLGLSHVLLCLTGRSVGWLGFDLRGVSALQDPPVYCLCVCVCLFLWQGEQIKRQRVYSWTRVSLSWIKEYPEEIAYLL